VPLLSAKPFYLAKRHSFYACRYQGFLHRLCFKRLDDCLDFFHRAKTRTGVPNGKPDQRGQPFNVEYFSPEQNHGLRRSNGFKNLTNNYSGGLWPPVAWISTLIEPLQ
jgi:hypothetical protein